MDRRKADKDPTISDTVIMERPGLWEVARRDGAVAEKAPAAGETRPAAPASPDKAS